MKPVKSPWMMWPPLVIVRYWLHQGNRYMNWVELTHRWLLELTVFVPLLIYFQTEYTFSYAAILAFAISHTCSAIFNGHLFAMLAHDLFWLSLYKDRRRFFDYIDQSRIRLEKKAPEYMAGAIFFGSICRGVFRDTSDLDIRYIANDGVWNSFRTAHLVFLERLNALFSGYPLDAYMFISKSEIGKKMDLVNESPVAIYLHGGKVKSILPNTQPFEKFRDTFLSAENE